MKRRDFLSTVGAGAGVIALELGGTSAASATASERALRLVPARRADDLCRNYLINTKIFHADSVYRHTGAVVDLLEELGVRVIRERITTGSSQGTQNQLRAMPHLARQGITWHGTVGTLSDWRHAQRANRQVMDFLTSHYAPRMNGDLGELMHSFGGCNEVDGPQRHGRRDKHWARHARRMQKALWEQAKDNRHTRDIPVAGPSTRTDFTARRAEHLGDLSRWSELGNAHLYNKGTSPTRGLRDHLKIMRRCFPGTGRFLFTETGYNNSPQTNANATVPEFASAIYGVRGIFDYFQRNAMYGRFELLDDPDRIDHRTQRRINATADIQAHFGLVAMTRGSVRDSTPDTWRKKPEFYAMKRLLRVLSDHGHSFTPRPLRMALHGGGRDVHHVLLQKRDGRHYLAVWRDVKVSEGFPHGRELRVDAVRIRVRLAHARPIRLWNPNTSSEPVGHHSATNDFNIWLRGELKLVEIG